MLFLEISFFLRIMELEDICNLLEPESDKFSADICTPELLLLWDMLFILLFIIDLDRDKKPLFEKIKLLFALWFWIFWGLFIKEVLFLLLFIEKWEDSTCILDEDEIMLLTVIDTSIERRKH